MIRLLCVPTLEPSLIKYRPGKSHFPSLSEKSGTLAHLRQNIKKGFYCFIERCAKGSELKHLARESNIVGPSELITTVKEIKMLQ